MTTFLKIITNKIVLTALVGVIQSLVLRYLNVPDEVWVSINALLLAIIGVFASEDISNKIVSGMRTMFTEFREQDAKTPKKAGKLADPKATLLSYDDKG